MMRNAFDRVLLLSRVPAFAGLLPDDLASLAHRASERRMGPREAWGDPEGADVGLVHEGSIEIGPEHRPAAAPALVGALEAFAGVELVARGGPGGARVSAVARADLEGVMTDVYEVWIAMLRYAAGRWHDAEPVVADAPRVVRPSRREDPASIVTRILLLSESDPFRKLSTLTVARVAHAAEELRLDPGQALWEEGDASEASYFVLGGTFRVDGSDEATDPGGPGATLGVREALAGRPRADRVTASSKARVLRVANDVLIDELEDDPDAAVALLASIASRALRAEDDRCGRGEEGP